MFDLRTLSLFLAILFSRASFYSMDYVHQYFPGRLSDSWSIYFAISTDDVKGVILQIFDSGRNQFGIEVIGGSNGTQVRIKYNSIYRLAQMLTPNKCRSCKVTNMTCGIRLQNGMLTVWSNHFISQSFSVVTDKIDDQRRYKGENSDVRIHPFPKTMTNKSETLYIMMGNIGPYVSENGTSVYPLRDQMEGCVEIFKYNGTQISLIQNGTRLRSSCPHKCKDNICNGGQCQQQSSSVLFCNCSATALNGMFCDGSLKKYVPGSMNSFEKVKKANEVHLKLTWKHLLDKIYCLIDIVTEYKHATITINKSHLMLNSVNISDISIHGVNFVTVIIAHNYLVVKTEARRDEYKVEFSIDTALTINVGFSVRNSCETFEGAYDLHFNPSLLRLSQYSTKLPNWKLTLKHIRTTILLRNISIENRLRISSSIWMIVMIASLAVVLMIVVIILCAVNLAMTLKKRNNVTPGNDYEEEPMELNVGRVVTSTNIDTSRYSTLNYDHMYVVNMEDGEDIDGYILPKIRLMEEVLPPLPPRI